MVLDAAIYNLTQSLWGAFGQASQAVMRQQEVPPPVPQPLLGIQAGQAESPGWFLLQAAEFDPEPLTVAKLRVRDVYASPRIVRALLDVMTAEKWFDRRRGTYYLTAAGRERIEQTQQRRQMLMRSLQPLPQAEMSRMERLCCRVIEASLDNGDRPGTWCLAHSRRRAPADEAPIPLKLFHYVADFNAFRDDAHMAAWQPYELAGYVWEAFSFVAADQAVTAVSLFDQLSYRGYSILEYATALKELAERGWLTTEEGERFTVTENGRVVHDEVERRTNDYFFTPWQQALSDVEIHDLLALIARLRDGLQAAGG